MNRSFKIILGLACAGIIGAGGIKLAENKAEEILRADFDRIAKENYQKEKIEISIGKISVNLLKREILGSQLSFFKEDEDFSMNATIDHVYSSGVNLIDLVQNPDAIRSDVLGASDLVIKFTPKKAKVDKGDVVAQIADIRIEGSNFGELNPQFEKMDELSPEEVITLLKALRAERLAVSDFSVKAQDGSIGLSKMVVKDIFEATAKSMELNDFSLNDEKGKIAGFDRLYYVASDFIDEFAQKADLGIDKIKIQLPADRKDETLQEFTEVLGRNDLVVNMHAKYSLDLEKRILDYKELSFDLENALKLDVSMKIGGFPTLEKMRELQELTFQMENENDIPPQFLELLQQLSFIEAEISLEDKKLVGALLKKQAQQSQQSPEAMAIALGMFAHQAIEGFFGPRKAAQVSGDVIKLMQKGGKLTLRAAALNEEPINLFEGFATLMMQPELVAQKIDIASTHK